VRRAGDRVRITAELVRAGDQVQLWAESYDRTMEDVLELQADVAKRIGEHLAVELLPSERTQQSVTPRAYEAYLRGRFHWNKRSEAGLAKAVEYYRESIALDPGFALAYVGLADVYNVVGLYGVVGWNSFAPPKESAQEARMAVAKALELEPNLGEAHTALAFSKFLYDWDWQDAEREFQLALRLNSNDVTAHGWYALFLSAMGRAEDALASIDRALALDPLSLAANSHKGWIFYFARRYDDAIAQLQSTRDMDPTFPLARYILGLTYIQKRTYREALQEFQHAFASLGHPGIFDALRQQYMQALTGQQANPLAAGQLPEYLLALAHVSLGNKNAALDCLDRAYEQRSCWLVNLRVEPVVDALREEPRFRKLLGGVGLV
jgi:tetratricopeptide (TPR) repeat protein